MAVVLDPWVKIINVHWKRPTTETEPPPVTETSGGTETEPPPFIIRTDRLVVGTSPSVTETIGFRLASTHSATAVGEIVSGSSVPPLGLALNELSVWRYLELPPLSSASPATMQTVAFLGDVVSAVAGKAVYINGALFCEFPTETGPFFGYRATEAPSGETFLEIGEGVFTGGDTPFEFLYALSNGGLYTVTLGDAGT